LLDFGLFKNDSTILPADKTSKLLHCQGGDSNP
jgi:hypothetical protein